jgi:hypothetical protein
VEKVTGVDSCPVVGQEVCCSTDAKGGGFKEDRFVRARTAVRLTVHKLQPSQTSGRVPALLSNEAGNTNPAKFYTKFIMRSVTSRSTLPTRVEMALNCSIQVLKRSGPQP